MNGRSDVHHKIGSGRVIYLDKPSRAWGHPDSPSSYSVARRNLAILSLREGQIFRKWIWNLVECLARGTVALFTAAQVADLASLTGELTGGVTVHAVDRVGNASVVALNISEPEYYWYWSETIPRAERRRAEHVNATDLRQTPAHSLAASGPCPANPGGRSCVDGSCPALGRSSAVNWAWVGMRCRIFGIENKASVACFGRTD